MKLLQTLVSRSDCQCNRPEFDPNILREITGTGIYKVQKKSTTRQQCIFKPRVSKEGNLAGIFLISSIS